MPNRINVYYISLIKPYIGRMMARDNRNRHWQMGQALVEYAVVLILAVGALVAMQVYLQRGLQARYKEASDKAIKELRQAKNELRLSLQYEPYYHQSEITAESSSKTIDAYSPGGASSEQVLYDKTSRRGVRYELPYSDGAEE